MINVYDYSPYTKQRSSGVDMNIYVETKSYCITVTGSYAFEKITEIRVTWLIFAPINVIRFGNFCLEDIKNKKNVYALCIDYFKANHFT